MEIGNTLRAARESKGISLEVAENHTKIRRKYLEALENEKFDLMPGRVYVKGFLKNYANFLGVNPKTLISAYEDMVPASDRDDEPPVSKLTDIDRPGGGKVFKYILALAALALVAGLVFLPSLRVEKEMIPPAGSDQKTAGESVPTPADKAGQAKPLPPQEKSQGVRVILNVTDYESWMRVEVDGERAFEGLMSAGQKKEFKGNEKITLRLGNAGVVQVEFNGQKIGVLGGDGQVVTKEFEAPQG